MENKLNRSAGEARAMDAMPIDNLAELQAKVSMSGFSDYFNHQIEEEVRSGKEQIALHRRLQMDGDTMDYKLDLRVDKVKRKGYQNDMLATLTEDGGVVRSQQFPRYLRITAKEAYNLLKWGISSGVEKHLFNREGSRYRSFITLDIHGEKDLYGSYPLLQYHENYYREPFTVEGALRRLPVEIKEAKTDPERLAASLKRGNMTTVSAVIDDRVQQLFLSVNAKAGRLDVRDAALALLKLD